MWMILCLVCLVIDSTLASTTVPRIFPVYASLPSDPKNDTIDVVVSSMYRTEQIQRRSGVVLDNDGLNRSITPDGFIEAKDFCGKDSVGSCWTYYVTQMIRNFLQSVPSVSKFDGRSHENTTPHLVGLPVSSMGNLTILGRSGEWAFGNVYSFFEGQLSRFIEEHGIIFPVTDSWDGAPGNQFQVPVIIENEGEREKELSRRSKKKSILFPLLVLFKFFKIKMILIPILLTVLLVKKLLIATLALAPNLAGFFRVCRPPLGGPFGLAPAGLLQDITDSRGEFSNVYNAYAHPYRDYSGYRTRDLGRWSESPKQTNEPSPDY